MITTKRRSFYDADVVLNKAFNQESESTELLLGLVPVFSQITEIVRGIEDTRKSVLKKYTEKYDNGNDKLKKDGTKVGILPENKIKADEEFNAYLDEEITIDGTLPLEFVKEMKMSVSELTVIDFLIDKTK